MQDKYLEDFHNLCECGFIACNESDEHSALALFDAAKLLKPDSTLPILGFGYLHMLKLQLSFAKQCFEEVVKKEPSNQLAQVFLGMTQAFHIDDKHVKEGLQIIEKAKAAANSKDFIAKDSAQAAISFIDEWILKKNKTPGPATVRKVG